MSGPSEGTQAARPTPIVTAEQGGSAIFEQPSTSTTNAPEYPHIHTRSSSTSAGTAAGGANENVIGPGTTGEGLERPSSFASPS